MDSALAFRRVASEHSLGLRIFYRFYKPFESWLLQRADLVIATSPPYQRPVRHLNLSNTNAGGAPGY